MLLLVTLLALVTWTLWAVTKLVEDGNGSISSAKNSGEGNNNAHIDIDSDEGETDVVCTDGFHRLGRHSACTPCPADTFSLPSRGMHECRPRFDCDTIRELGVDAKGISAGGVKMMFR